MSNYIDKNILPPFMRKSVSKTFLLHNPNYKDVFKQCPSCGKYSFVNIDRNGNKIKGRRCRVCENYNDQAT